MPLGVNPFPAYGFVIQATPTVDYARWVDLISHILLGVASIAVALLAYRAWRVQFVLTKRYELARKVLLQVFQVRESISIVRDSPVHPITGRLSDVLDEKMWMSTKTDEKVESARKRLEYHHRVYEERWKVAWGSGETDANAAFSQRLSELALARSEVKVVLSADQAQKIEAVETCMRKLAFAFGQYFYQAELYTSVIGHPELQVDAFVRTHGYKKPFNREHARERIKWAASVLQALDKNEIDKDEQDAFGKKLDLALSNAEKSFDEVLRLER